MSTRVNWLRAGFFKNFAGFALASTALAGCSEGAARFADPLFTAAVQQPQPVNQQGFGQFNGGVVGQVPARVRQNVPQRLDIPQQQFSQADTFNARSLSAQTLGGAVVNQVGVPQAVTRPAQQLASAQTFQGFPARPTLSQPTIAQPTSVVRQALPPAQQLPKTSTLASTANNGNRLTLEDAQAINDVEASQPLLGRPQAVNNPATTNQSFPVGTQWTRKYSPIPTQSPAPKGQGPKAYTPPQGVYTADVDRTSTSSITKFTEPKIVRSSVAPSPIKQVLRPQPTQVDRQTTASIAPRPTTAKNGWSSAGGTYVSLRSGETLYSLSKRYGVPVDAISRTNGIADPTSVRVGQKILIPTYVYAPNVGVSAPDANKHVANASSGSLPSTPKTVRSSVDPVTTASIRKAPTQPLPPKIVASSQTFGAHTVQKGDTLSKIGRKYGTSAASIQAANGLGDGNLIKIGQVLSIPRASNTVASANSTQSVAALPRLDQTTTASIVARPQAPAVTAAKFAPAAVPRSRPNYVPVSRKVVSKPTLSSQPKANPVRRVAVAKPAPTAVKKPVNAYAPPKIDKTTTASVKSPAATTLTSFKWPVRGNVVKKFDSKNAGINIAVPEGTPVRSSAAGEVIYAANGLADYGNLVLIRHSNGFVTAYAHNKSLMVRRGQRVRQGQVVAKSGKTGSVTSPQVHFEVREGKKPVNPLSHLSG